MIADIIIAGDQHYDLKSDGIDRNDDIEMADIQIVEYTEKIKKNNPLTFLFRAGDTFHGTRPRSDSIARVISMYERLNGNGINTYIIVGNHDVIDQKGMTSALEPIIAANFDCINIYHDMEIVKIYKGINLITLPHISKARAVEYGFKTVQEYIETKAEEIVDKLSKNDINIVLGHMNITGAKTGTENFMIKGAHEDFPYSFKRNKKINYIFNGHFHKAQIINNSEGAPIIVTGDISTNDFGERLDRKCFFHLQLEV